MVSTSGNTFISGWKETWHLAAPSSAVFFMVTLANLVVIKIVAGLGTDAIAAVTTAARLYNIFNAVLMGLSAGTLALISRAWGAQQRQQAGQLLQTSLMIAVAIGVGMSSLLILISPWLLNLFELSPGANQYSLLYIERFALFFTAIACYVILASGLRACGDARTPMLFAAWINLLIVFFCYALSYGFAGLPAMGIRGAGWGVGIGNLLGIACALWYWQRGRLRLQPIPGPDPQRWQNLKKLWSLGYPAALEQGVLQVGLIAYLWVVADYGTAAYAAYGIGLTLLSLSIVIGYGFSIAGSILVGQQIGAGNIEGARQAGWRAMRQSATILLVLSIAIAPFASYLAHWLAGDGEVAAYTTQFMYILCLAQPLLAIDMSLSGALRGAGDTRFPLFATLTGMVVIRFGLALIILQLQWPVIWVFAVILVDYLVKVLLYLHRFRSDAWTRKLATTH